MTRSNNEKLDIKEILEEYKPDDDIFNDEDELINNLKHIIYQKLNEVDKRIILMYAELKSLRKLGEELGISASSAFFKIKEIRNKIYNELNNYA